MSTAIGNTVQCGVYLINGGGATYPVPFSGNYEQLRILNDCDDHYLVYPGFSVWVDTNSSSNAFKCDNTTGKSPLMYDLGSPYNQASNWRVFYMGIEIKFPGLTNSVKLTTSFYA